MFDLVLRIRTQLSIWLNKDRMARRNSPVPCAALNPKGSLDCVTNSAWVSWDNSAGSLSYMAVAEAMTGGHRINCTALRSDPSCNIPDLKCGTKYIFHVMAANAYCQNHNSSTFMLETGYCAMENITAVTECGSNRILVSWQMAGESPLYLVTAEGHDQTLISCNSTEDYCELEGADCGMRYTVVVSASSDKCRSLRSPPIQVNTAPCVPSGVAVAVTCEAGAAVSWSPSAMDASFLVTATGASGDVRTCEASHTNCTLAGLPCGEMYTVNVTASDDNCTSQPSADFFFQTVPCSPTGLSVDYQCETGLAVLSWTASDGGVEYYSYAHDTAGGDPLSCTTTVTTCAIPLDCGSVYNFSVMASDGHCNSSHSAPLQAGAVPCTPTGLKVRVRVIGNQQLAMSWWTGSDCPGVEYLARVTGRIEDHPHALLEMLSYPTERLYFEFPMPCGTAFNLTVSAQSGSGVSDPTEPFNGVTAPCPPASARFSGDSQAATVQWDAAVFATQYTVYDSAHAAVCSTASLSCPVSGVDPTSLAVTASNAVGESGPSNVTGMHVASLLNIYVLYMLVLNIYKQFAFPVNDCFCLCL
ncbi:Fibronectin type III domain-containing protein 7 [Merluccius polli]|uniref:Fibronectin type III domain-containing protein 7 n=1 Tax=Merluccius polli TaxID=89951 RepID=A0AA47LZ52_MERPO|nr:Fibronectin type III domain-containing protein 7 [Merluccius polli]